MQHPPLNPRAQAMQAFVEMHCGADTAMNPLVGDASFRRYVRVKQSGRDFMLMDAPPPRENVRPYVAVAEQLLIHGYSVPAIIARDVEAGFLLLEDLGDDTFSRALKSGNADEMKLYQAGVDVLIDWHQKKTIRHDLLPLPAYDTALLTQELKLFSHWFLPQILDADELARGRKEYDLIWQHILDEASLSTDYFVHRDYHADNLMWLPERTGCGNVGLLDFQDAVYGDPAYDVMSLLEDARRDVPHTLAEDMKAYFKNKTAIDAKQFDAAYALLAAQRNLKIVGIFTRLAARDGKHHYLQMLPRVWDHIGRDAKHPSLVVLKNWLDKTIPKHYRQSIPIRHDAQALGLVA